MKGQFKEILDTIQYIPETQQNIILPNSFGIGFTIQKEQQWVFGFDYRVIDYKKFTWPTIQPSLGQHTKLSVGVQYYPAKNPGLGFLKHTYYRAGIKTQTMPFQIAGQSVNENAITFGLGMPLKRTTSTVNLGFEFGQRGTASKGQLVEQYVNLSVGFMLNDLWFQRSKID